MLMDQMIGGPVRGNSGWCRRADRRTDLPETRVSCPVMPVRVFGRKWRGSGSFALRRPQTMRTLGPRNNRSTCSVSSHGRERVCMRSPVIVRESNCHVSSALGGRKESSTETKLRRTRYRGPRSSGRSAITDFNSGESAISRRGRRGSYGRGSSGLVADFSRFHIAI